MPVRNVLVGDTGCYVEHDDTALPVNIVSVTKTSKLLLTSGIPDIELDVAQVLAGSLVSFSRGRFGKAHRAKSQRMDLNTKGGDVLLLELSGQMTLDERGLSSR